MYIKESRIKMYKIVGKIMSKVEKFTEVII